MKNLLLVFVVAFFSCQAMAQINLDSLWTIWNDQSQPDTSRLKAINRIAWDGYLFSQPESAYYFVQLHFEFADSKGLKKSMASALNTQGVSFVIRGNYPEALKHYQKSLSIQEEIDNKAGISTLLGNIGLIYADQHNYSEALNYYHRSLAIKGEKGDKHGLHHTFNNIGGAYQEQGNYEKALEYHQKKPGHLRRVGSQTRQGQFLRKHWDDLCKTRQDVRSS